MFQLLKEEGITSNSVTLPGTFLMNSDRVISYASTGLDVNALETAISSLTTVPSDKTMESSDDSAEDNSTMGDQTTGQGDDSVSTSDSGESSVETAAVSQIKITASYTKVAAGKKLSLQASVTPNNATNKTLTWTSSNIKYATVSDKGVVTTKAAGAGKTVTITAKATDGSGQSATFDLQIMKGTVKKITAKAASSVKAGGSTTIKTTVKATAGANKKLSFTSSNKKYATVTSKGVVKTYKEGKGKTVKITVAATDGSGKKTTVKIKIK
jgi:uncharacterized protein YjdB